MPFFSGADWNDFLPPRWIFCPLGPVRAVVDLHFSPLYLRAFDKSSTRWIWIKRNFERSLCALIAKPILKKSTPKQPAFWAWLNSLGIKALVFGDCCPLLLSGANFPAQSVKVWREKQDLASGFAGDTHISQRYCKNTPLLKGVQIQGLKGNKQSIYKRSH